MDKGKFDFGVEVSRMLPRIIREVTKRQITVLSNRELSLPIIVILELLKEDGPCRMSDLAGALDLSMGGVTGIVDRMIKMKLLRRDRSVNDRRVVKVALLKRGEDTVGAINKLRRKTADDIFSALSGTEKKEYVRLLTKVYNNLRKG